MVNVSIIGIGMGNRKTLTVEALEKVEKADLIIGAKRMCEAFSDLNKSCLYEYKSVEIMNIIESVSVENVVVLMSGDTGFYSGAKNLTTLLNRKKYNVTLYPGISSISYFCAKIQVPYDNTYITSLHGREDNIEYIVRHNEKVFLLTDNNIDLICKRLIAANLDEVLIYVGERLSYEDERILKGSPEEILDSHVKKIAVVMIINKNAKTRSYGSINDSEFIRGKVPMTKEAVRTLSVGKMKLKEDYIVYDIGAGTGSVSIEVSNLVPFGKVYSIEQKEEAIELINSNKEKFNANNIEVIDGRAPEILEELEKPDVVFIGGSSGKLEQIVDCVMEKTNRFRIVVNAITIETIMNAIIVLKKYSCEDFDISQVNISNAKQVGNYNMMIASNPVYIISADVVKKGMEEVAQDDTSIIINEVIDNISKKEDNELNEADSKEENSDDRDGFKEDFASIRGLV